MNVPVGSAEKRRDMVWLVLILALIAGPLGAQVEFSELNLSPDDRLLFRLDFREPQGEEQRTHFLLDLNQGKLEALSHVPDSLQYLASIGRLQFQNRFGLFRLQDDGSLEVISREAFLKGTPLDAGLPLPILPSPDGRWLLFQTPIDPIRGDLILYEIATGTSHVVSRGMLQVFREVPARWSPDSQFVVYTRDGEVYYFSIRQLREGRVPAEILRTLGRGSLRGLQWTEEGTLLLAQDQVIFRILPEEFFTLSLYGGLLRTWGISARLPHPFDPNRDAFWLSPDRRWVLYCLGGRGLFLLPFDNLDFHLSTDWVSSYVPIPGGMRIHKAVWTQADGAVVHLSHFQEGQILHQVVVVRPGGAQVLQGPQALPILDILVSPERGRLAVLSRTGVTVYQSRDWKAEAQIAHEGATAMVWMAENRLVVGGLRETAVYEPGKDGKTLLLLGQLDEVGFLADGAIGARSEDRFYLWKGQGRWEPAERLVILPAVQVNAANRVYVEDLAGGPYRNLIYARNLRSFGTRALLPAPSRTYEPFPEREGSVGRDIFTNGSRLRARQVSLVIDAEVEDEGFTEALRALGEWGYRTTFFVNGEFLRRNPGAVRELSRTTHEVGNMFLMSFNMGDPRFVIERDFIRRGLARLEDDYHALTGRELSLIWHTPGYYVSPAVIQGGKDANYQFISRDVDLVGRQRTVDTVRFLEQILEKKKPGSIIPLPLGLRDEKTGESIFLRLDVLLNALTVQGYRVVPVSVLRESLR